MYAASAFHHAFLTPIAADDSNGCIGFMVVMVGTSAS
jgi:hypothetical protein